jgi:hypothetical protein
VKVVGPILGGAMVRGLGFASTFAIMGEALLAAAAVIGAIHLRPTQPQRRPASS